MKSEIDESDGLILTQLQQDAKISIDALAEHSGLSIASVQRRLKKLRDNKVIEREIAIINPKAVDQGMTFIVMVELERERLDQLDSFRRKVRSDPQVQQCYYVTGVSDFILICITRDMAEFESLTHRLFFDDANVRRFSTSIAMDRTKVGMFIQIPEKEK